MMHITNYDPSRTVNGRFTDFPSVDDDLVATIIGRKRTDKPRVRCHSNGYKGNAAPMWPRRPYDGSTTTLVTDTYRYRNKLVRNAP